MPELEPDPQWYKDAIIYEVHVRAFHDSDGDGMGDFAGLTRRLDYLQDLGVTAVWVLPFCPSPWKDDGYDISDYTGVHPAYGTLRDFETFLQEAHRRGLRVVTELVANHTSDQHEWFQLSRRAAPGSPWREFYVWSDTPEKYRDARIIFKDFEASNWTWDPIAKAYFWHRFYSHQPDLNYDNPEVRATMLRMMDFWLDRGVDGLRLDAVPYLYEREGTTCENLPETHGFLKELRAHVDQKYRDRMILAEANQWPEDAIAYFGAGDECHMAFHFPLMPRLFMATRMEDRYPITDILELTPPIPETSQWALFLRNHDELTLEMVTDEERDYMYRVYAQDRQMRINLGIRRRLAPLLGNDRRRIELMNALLFSLPGTPVIYYGDEIGMGDNFYLGDRNGVRTPMQWSADRNAGFSRANPQRLYLPVIIDPEYHYESLNVEAQQNNPHSLLWWMKRIIAQRKSTRAFGRGTLEFLYPDNRRVLAFVRRYEGESVLVVANLSRFAQSAELDLSPYQGAVPVEMFGRADFPAVADRPYAISLGPHAFYWLSLEQRPTGESPITTAAGKQPVFPVPGWGNVFSPRVRYGIARLLPDFLRQRRWFKGQRRRIRDVDVIDVLPLAPSAAHLLVLRVDYSAGDPEYYTLPLSAASGEAAERVAQQMPEYIMARLEGPGGTRGVLYGSLWDRSFGTALLAAMARRCRFPGSSGEISAGHTGAFRALWNRTLPEHAYARGDHNNSSLTFGDRFILKLYRRIEAGVHPEWEIGRFLTDAKFPNVPPLAGWLEYRAATGEAGVLGVLHALAPHEADAWDYTMDNLGLFFERVIAAGGETAVAGLPQDAPTALYQQPLPAPALELIGTYAELIRVLGQRTAELHAALAAGTQPDFAPEPFTDFYRQGLYHGMLGAMVRTLELLRKRLPGFPGELQVETERLLAREREIRARFQQLRDQRVRALRARIHGDFELRQVLFTGRDFLIIDFEGDLERSLSQRRLKQSPLRDVASMLRSFHYAAHAALFGLVPGVLAREESRPQLQRWAEFWYRWVGTSFLAGYFGSGVTAGFLPESAEDTRVLLRAYMLEKALLEVAFEITHRPDWTRIPVHGILDLLSQ